jgi:hypothetical protein
VQELILYSALERSASAGDDALYSDRDIPPLPHAAVLAPVFLVLVSVGFSCAV